jgi:hypothetical protein
VQQVIRPNEVLLQSSVQCPVPSELDCGTEVLMAHSTHFTGFARDGGVDGHPATGVRPGDGDGRELVSWHDGTFDAILTDTAVGEPMQVGATDAHRGNRQQRPTLGWLARVGLVGHSEVPDGVQTRGDHQVTSAQSPAATW